MRTVEVNFGIPIHYYVRINFRGFQTIIDALGGIDVDVPEAIRDYADRLVELGDSVPESIPSFRFTRPGNDGGWFVDVRRGTTDLVGRLFQSEDPKSYFHMRGGGIGWGIPAALGVKLALGDRPVVALIGDGSAIKL